MTGKKKQGLFLFIGITVLLFFPLNVFAKNIFATELKIGPAKLKPTLSANTEYNSNIDLKNSDHKGSMVYRVTPGVSLQLPLERAFLETDLDISYVNVEKGDNTWAGHGRQLLRYNLSNMTSLGLSYDYSKGELYGSGSGNTFDLQDGLVMMKHQFDPRLAVTLEGDKEKYDTHIKGGSSLFSDYDENGGKVTVDYKLSPLTALSIGFIYADRDYNDVSEKDYKSFGESLGVSRKLTPRATIGANVGYTDRDYEIGESAKELTYGSNLNVILSSFSTLNIDYKHQLQDTFYPKDPNILWNAFATDDTLSNLLNENYRYMETDRIGANLIYHLTDKDTLDMAGAYIKSKSGQDLGALVSTDLQEKLKERNYYGGLGFSHKFTSWFSLGLKGTYGVRTSNVREKYDYYTASGGASLSF